MTAENRSPRLSSPLGASRALGKARQRSLHLLRRCMRPLRMIMDQLLSATSGLALLWVGWVVLVFFAVVGLLRLDGEGLTNDPYSVVLMALLGQSAVVTGIGLASIDHMNRSRRDTSVASAETGPIVSHERAALPPVHAVSAFQGATSARQGLLFPDGSIEVDTLLGPRRFSCVEDVFEFVGHGSANPVASPSTHH